MAEHKARVSKIRSQSNDRRIAKRLAEARKSAAGSIFDTALMPWRSKPNTKYHTVSRIEKSLGRWLDICGVDTPDGAMMLLNSFARAEWRAQRIAELIQGCNPEDAPKLMAQERTELEECRKALARFRVVDFAVADADKHKPKTTKWDKM